MKLREKVIDIVLVAVGGIVFLLAGCTAQGPGQSAEERGRYLVAAGGCGDCHSPKVFTGGNPVPDEARLLSGYPSDARLPEIPQGIIGPGRWGAVTTNDMTAWAGPWGVSFASNITPHPSTGIGNWSETLFVQAIRNGKYMGTSRDMLPPMPWQALARLTDEDLKAIFAYLKSIPPVENEVPTAIPPTQQ